MIEPNQTLRLDRLLLKNFRCFSHCEIKFDPTLTVLVAENGQGKTAILDALRKTLLIFTQMVGKARISSSIDETDIRVDREGQPQLPTRFEVDLLLRGVSHRVGREVRRFKRRPRNTKSELQYFLIQCAQLNGAAFGSSSEKLPIAAYFGTGRVYDQHRLTREKHFVAAKGPYRVGAYLDSLSLSASYKLFAAWYEAQMKALKDPANRVGSPEVHPEKLLAAVEEAVRTVLNPTGWDEIGWIPAQTIGTGPGSVSRPGQVKLRNLDAGWLPLEYLSDGIRNMVALVGDIAHKCARLNPQCGTNAARETPGVVLIDEVDMHLHPRWQQTIIKLLQDAFPRIQFILTTHSPHVLTTVKAESIRSLTAIDGLGNAFQPYIQTQGDESGNVLARTMNVNPVPDIGPAKLLREYRALVQNAQDRSDQAQLAWHKLIEHFGEDHHLLREAAVLRDLQEFKRKNCES